MDGLLNLGKGRGIVSHTTVSTRSLFSYQKRSRSPGLGHALLFMSITVSDLSISSLVRTTNDNYKVEVEVEPITVNNKRIQSLSQYLENISVISDVFSR